MVEQKLLIISTRLFQEEGKVESYGFFIWTQRLTSFAALNGLEL